MLAGEERIEVKGTFRCVSPSRLHICGEYINLESNLAHNSGSSSVFVELMRNRAQQEPWQQHGQVRPDDVFPGDVCVQLACGFQRFPKHILFPIFCSFQNMVSVPFWKMPPNILDNPTFFVSAERPTARLAPNKRCVLVFSSSLGKRAQFAPKVPIFCELNSNYHTGRSLKFDRRTCEKTRKNDLTRS